jgi:cardiolipin synthase A/B
MAQNETGNKYSIRRLIKRQRSPRLAVHETWQSERLFTDATQYFAMLLRDIRKAQHSIDLNFYIVKLDQLGNTVINALIKAQNRGVQVRLIMDGIGSSEYAGLIADRMSKAGCQVKIFRPLPFASRLYRWSGIQGHYVQKLLHFLININQRNHYKLGIIDQQIVWSGSFNITNDHLSTELGGQGWRDYGVRLTDEKLDDVQHCFDAMWGGAEKRPMLSRWHRVRTNLSPSMRRYYNKLMLFRIRYAKQRIWISNAYFAPSRAVMRALIQARKNNVDVRLILTSASDVALFPTISRSYYRPLLKHGIKIYKYQPRILHAKVMLIDGHCWIGSTNLNHRSFYHDLELDITLHHEDTINMVAQELSLDMQQSELLALNRLSRFSWALVKAYFLRLFRYWL